MVRPHAPPSARIRIAGRRLGLRRVLRRLLMPALALAALALSGSQALAQDRVVTGRVSDIESGEPLASAQIALKGIAGRGTFTRDDGTFSLPVPTRDVVLVVRRIGYPLKEVPVSAGTPTVAITMKKDVLKLDQVVVTGQATAISRRNLPNSVASVDAEQLSKVPAPSIENALQGKVAGVQIQSNTGAPGGGNRVRLRGISSILGNAQPLYVIDGVLVADVAIAPGTNRVTRASGSVTIGVESQENPINRIADIDPNMIENIEVLKGAAAAAIYGSKASGGVIMITTKRGRAGRPQYSLRTGVGTSRLAYKEGSRRFQSLDDAMAVFGARTPDFWQQAWTPNNRFDYEELMLGGKPVNHETSLSVSGGNENTRFFVSGLVKRDEGIVRNTFADKKSLRLNLDQTLGSRMTASVGAEVIRNGADRGLFGNDNSGNSVMYTITKLPSFFDFRRNADGTYPLNPFYPSNPFQTIDLFQNRETVWRSMGNARLTYEALTGASQQLRFIASGGVDNFTQRNFVFSPPELQFEPTNDGLPGTAVSNYGQNVQYNINLNAVHGWQPSSWISLTSQLGTQYEVRDFDLTQTVGQNLLGGLAVVDAGTVRDVNEDRLATNDFGVFGQTEVLLKERFLLTAGMRADRSSNNGEVGKYYFFPKLATSYRHPALWAGILDEAKVRLAYGETGNLPRYGQKFTSLSSGVIGGAGGFTLGGERGFPGIRPERQRELEGGVDLTLFDNRGQLELTGFQRDISDLLIQRTLAPTTGFATEVYNGAEMRVRGFETVLSAFPVRGYHGVTWNTRVNFALNRSEITKLPVPAFLISTPQVGAIRIELGRSATQLVGNDTVAVAGTCPANPMPPFDCSKTTVGQVMPVYMGDGNPDYTMGLSNEVRWKGVSLYGNLDRQKGGMLAAGTWRHFDLGQNSRDYDDPGPGGKKLGKWRTDTYLRVTRVYYQDISYWKLRELTLAYDLPRSVLNKTWSRASEARLSMSGRNLKTWTKYRGGDPDFANFGGTPDALQRNRELASYPTSRQFWLNLSLSF